MAHDDILNPDDAESPDPEAPSAAESSDTEATGLEIVKRERDDYFDRLLRKTAEFDNYRKRVERERRTHADHAVENLLLDLLLVVDDFDRALTADAGDASNSYRKGIELIHSKFQNLLRKQGVKPIVALGADFDPNLHQAVTQESSPEHREGEVIEELQRGYMIGDRLLRPAMVKVATA